MRRSRAVNKTGYTGNVQSKLSLLFRCFTQFTLHPLVFPEGSLYSPTAFLAIDAATQVLIQPRTAPIRAQIRIIDRDATDAVRLTAEYINVKATGRRRVIALSGIQENKQTRNTSALSAVTNLRQFISPDVSRGWIKLSWEKPRGNKTRKGISYLVEMYPAGHFDRLRDVAITNKTFLTFDTGDLNEIELFVRVTPVHGVASPWLSVRAQF